MRVLKVQLEHAIETGIREVQAAEFALVRDLRLDELEALADADPHTIMARITGLSPEMCARLTDNDRTNIQAARAAIRRG